MREIRFRAVSMCKGEHFVYGDLLHYARNPHTEKWIIHDPATGIETYIDERTIGQFTGLQDKNGRDIYEGDIVVSDDWSGEKSKVIYRDGQWIRIADDNRWLSLLQDTDNVSETMYHIEVLNPKL